MLGALADLRLAIACLLAFAGFFHFRELVGLRASNVVVYQDHATVHISLSKIDPLQQGNEVVTARTGNPTCPIAMLEAYMKKTGNRWNEQHLLFRPICSSKAAESLRGVQSISYTFLRDKFKTKL